MLGLFAIIALLVALMIWVAIETTRTFRIEQAARHQVELTSAVLIEVNRAYSAVINAETAQRGFVLTERSDYLEPYETASATFAGAIENLRGLLAGAATETQKSLVDKLESLGNDKFSELSLTIAFVKGGKSDEALAVVNTDRGKEIMDRFRVVIRQLEAYEQGILVSALERAKRAQDRYSLMFLLLGSGVVLLFGMLLFQGWRTARLAQVEGNLEAVETEKAKTELLARELNHRVKNLFAIVLSLIRNSGREETDAREATKKIHERVYALARAHELTATIDGPGRTTLDDLVSAVALPYISSEDAISIDGPPVPVSAEQVTPLGLIINELATNAVKYGAWAEGQDGRVSISWNHDGGDGLSLRWSERHNGAADSQEIDEGFGSSLMRLSTQQLGGEMKRTLKDGQLFWSLDFKLADGTKER
ncbi:sensor histidine kinase [Oricola cellulosilytica]|uniref:histidine kinase n=1 Tax=Oricola cellulosilytica TaxID=1429082 RepID=A0A4R0PFG3_9HYPH|nr:CHASE3 domain-containing protein [Oricola cellulosilytica]TCD16577.1 hypothetical protein E0D97_03930 [Oricola cellulosilytica]